MDFGRQCPPSLASLLTWAEHWGRMTEVLTPDIYRAHCGEI